MNIKYIYTQDEKPGVAQGNKKINYEENAMKKFKLYLPISPPAQGTQNFPQYKTEALYYVDIYNFTLKV